MSAFLQVSKDIQSSGEMIAWMCVLLLSCELMVSILGVVMPPWGSQNLSLPLYLTEQGRQKTDLSQGVSLSHALRSFSHASCTVLRLSCFDQSLLFLPVLAFWSSANKNFLHDVWMKDNQANTKGPNEGSYWHVALGSATICPRISACLEPHRLQPPLLRNHLADRPHFLCSHCLT